MTEYLGKSCTHRSMYKTDTNASPYTPTSASLARELYIWTVSYTGILCGLWSVLPGISARSAEKLLAILMRFGAA